LDFPKTGPLQKIKTNDKQFVLMVSCVLNKYRRNKAVKKTLTIPQWLNEEATAKNINFSSVLKKALQEELVKL
jgi:hypothetical protein